MPNLTEIVCQGWLTKSPPTRGIFRPVSRFELIVDVINGWIKLNLYLLFLLLFAQRWRKRWFVLKGGNFIHQFVLEYYTDDSMKRLKGGINLDECMQVGMGGRRLMIF